MLYPRKIIGAAFEVSNVLGTGFLEKVYENALSLELNLSGLKTVQQAKSAFICVHLRFKIILQTRQPTFPNHHLSTSTNDIICIDTYYTKNK
jgi:hypothetical protein